MNIINAIINLVNNPITALVSHYPSRNRVNLAGKALEEFTKDLFADSFHLGGADRETALRKVFSYTGNANNPPDAMLLNGDAIEVKKIESDNAALALNSSHLKHKLYANSTLISNACRQAENWTEKDLIYVVGVVENLNLKHLAMVYGEDYLADEDTYFKGLDPLGITTINNASLNIENPFKVFSYVYVPNENAIFNFMAIINENKWKTLDNTDELSKYERLNISNIKIKSPNNPQLLQPAKLITFSI